MNATRRDPCKVCGNHLIEHDGKPFDVTCALCTSGAESQTVRIKLEVREDTLQVIRDCLRAAENDIDRLRAENEKLRQSPLKQALDAIAGAAANHLASEAKGCFEKGLIETIERLKAQNEKMRSFLVEVSRTSGDKWAVMAARNLLKEFGHD
jgi:uncharacterized Zn finger protein (UPF0148 family)